MSRRARIWSYLAPFMLLAAAAVLTSMAPPCDDLLDGHCESSFASEAATAALIAAVVAAATALAAALLWVAFWRHDHRR